MAETEDPDDVDGYFLDFDEDLGVGGFVSEEHVVNASAPDAEGVFEVVWPLVHRIQ